MIKLPFKIDRDSRIKLPYQVADGIRSAIQSGYWKPGDRLPSIRAMKQLLGVSMRAPSEAVQLLAQEGAIILREKCAPVVCAIKSPLTKGRVLLVDLGGVQVHASALLMERVRRNLNGAGYHVVTTSVFRKNVKFVEDNPDSYELHQLEQDLKMSYSLVVVYGQQPYTIGILRQIEASGVPFFLIGDRSADFKGFIGGIVFDNGAAIKELTIHCLRMGVRNAVLVRKWRKDGMDFAEAFRKAGIRVESVLVPQLSGRGRKEELWSNTLAVFRHRFAHKGKGALPELICFTDDHCFQGAMVAMSQYGIRVPDDVWVATVANVGSSPPFGISICKIEHDLLRQGNVVSRTIIDYLDKGLPVPSNLSIGASYVHGETFPDLPRR